MKEKQYCPTAREGCQKFWVLIQSYSLESSANLERRHLNIKACACVIDYVIGQKQKSKAKFTKNRFCYYLPTCMLQKVINSHDRL